MTKKKSPAPKRGGKKKCAPKKAVKRKPIPQQVTEKAVKERIGKTLFLGDQKLVAVPLGQGVVFDARDFDVVAIDSTERLTVEEQFERDQAEQASPPARAGLLRRALNRVKRAFRFRSAKTGEFVSQADAEASPDTTVRERV